jgi:hypothetical protein
MSRLMRPFRLLGFLAGFSALGACAGAGAVAEQSSAEGAGGAESCSPGATLACACPDGGSGEQICRDDGSFGGCACATDPCGDGVCAADESCQTCSADCHCAPCTQAPSCDGAAIPPIISEEVPSLDIAMRAVPREEIQARAEEQVARSDRGMRLLAAALAPSAELGEHPVVTRMRASLLAHPAIAASLRRHIERAGLLSVEAYRQLYPVRPAASVSHVRPDEFPDGAPECGDALLRMRVASVTVHEDLDDIDTENDIIYCAITAEAATGAEILITPKTPALNEGEQFSFSVAAGAVWGKAGPRATGGNLFLTYDCFEADSVDEYQKFLDSVSEGVIEAGGAVGDATPYGWIIEVVGVAIGIVSDALAFESDDHVFNATQIVPFEAQLDLTNGRYWKVRRHGTLGLSDWDWELRMEAWGCAEFGQGRP